MSNISKTYKTANAFVKEDCPEEGFDFQELMYHTLKTEGNFKINKPVSFSWQVKDDKKTSEARFELLPDLDFDVTLDACRLFGSNMAVMHNLSSILMISKELPYLDNKILHDTDSLEDDILHDVDSFRDIDISIAEMSLRELIVSTCKFMPVMTLPLHRDFRLHNIVFDGSCYHLIDFDFAAYDDVSMEVMGMVVDLLQHGFEYVEAFLTAYVESSNIDTYDSMASNYLLYLATSCFPYDREATLEPQAFENLTTERSERLIRLYLNMDNIAKFFQNK